MDKQQAYIKNCIETQLAHYHQYEGAGQSLSVYPQAFTRHYSNIQCANLIPVYLPLLVNIDHELWTKWLDTLEVEDDDDTDAAQLQREHSQWQ